MTYILALDTTVGGFTLAVQGPKGRRAWVAEATPRSSSALHPALVQVLADNAITPAEIEVLAVAVGPGSFTGCRIGMAFAEAWRLACPKVKVVGLPTLGCLALQVAGLVGAEGGFRVLLDAAGGQAYGQDYDGRGVALAEAFCLPLAEATATPLPLAAAGLPLLEAARWHLAGLGGEALLQAAADESCHGPLEIVYLKALNYKTKTQAQAETAHAPAHP